jgi:hypothetical protein
VDDQPVQFALGTGSLTSMINAAPTQDDRKKKSSVIHTRGRPAKISKLQIGNMMSKDVVMLRPEEHLLPNGVYGLLGADFLKKFDIELDLGHNIVRLFDPSSCGENSIYWANRFSEADLVIRGGQITVKVELDGMPARATVDTESAVTVVSWDLAKRLHLDRNSENIIKSGDGPDGSFRYKFSEIKIGDEIVKNPNLNIVDFVRLPFYGNSTYDFTDTDITLGNDFF